MQISWLKNKIKKLPVFFSLYALSKRVDDLNKQIKDLEESINEIILGNDPAETMIKHLCRSRKASVPNFEEPKTFNEKMLWLNVYDENPLKKICADKYAVREWVSQQIGKEYLIPLLGVYNSFEEIDFSKLPERFVLKPTHASGCNIVVANKGKMNMTALKEHFDFWLSYDYSRQFLEKCYYRIPRRIIAEEFLETKDHDLPDYKIFCIHGEPKLCWVDLDRSTNHTRNVYDTQWNLLPLTIRYPASSKIVPKPKGLTKMLELARKLSAPFKQVRVDFYNIEEKIYFGELTFVSGAGQEKFTPDSYNYDLGAMLHLPLTKGDK